MSAAADRWSDLKPRVLSAAVMLAVGGGAIWAGGPAFHALAVLVTGAMIWELARMQGAAGRVPVLLGLAGSAALAATIAALNAGYEGASLLLLLLPPVLGALVVPRDRGIFLVYGALIMASGIALAVLRHDGGLWLVIWLLSVVIASDVLGYFAGRLIGGPKFWPRISPKKTWSGTIAGWFGAALAGYACVHAFAGEAPGSLVLWSPLLAFAGQMGDIAESAIKRRAGVKDSSALIPGHGGLLDRFDALSAASVLALGLFLAGLLRAGG